MPSSKSILITGAGGYIGSFLTEAALQWTPHNIIAVDTFEGGKEGLLNCSRFKRLKVLKKSVFDLDTKDMKDVTRIIHLAALVGTKLCEEKPAEALRTNLNGTEYLCKLAV